MRAGLVRWLLERLARLLMPRWRPRPSIVQQYRALFDRPAKDQ